MKKTYVLLMITVLLTAFIGVGYAQDDGNKSVRQLIEKQTVAPVNVAIEYPACPAFVTVEAQPSSVLPESLFASTRILNLITAHSTGLRMHYCWRSNKEFKPCISNFVFIQHNRNVISTKRYSNG